MIRPVEQHERLHPKEYLDRVRKAEGVPESEPRDFSYVVREADRQKHEHSSGSDFGEDRYESAEEQTEDNSPDEQKRASTKPEPPAPTGEGDGSIDVTI